MKIVCIGGGTGLPVLLRSLRRLPDIKLTAMVCVSDNGGSSGRLRKDFDIPAVGDLRNCLVALSDENNALADLFQYRLPGEKGPGGHSVGNLVMAALACRSGSLREVVRRAGHLIQSKGRVLPSTETPSTLCAEFEEDTVIRGEVEITRHRKPIRRVWLEPHRPKPTAGLLGAILGADVIALGPGSLYTSIIPNLLVRGVPEAIRDSGATVMLVSNLMTQPGESESYTAAGHLRAIHDYLAPGTVNMCLLNSKPIHGPRLAKYASGEAYAVENDLPGIARQGVVPVAADLLDESTPEVRHDPAKLARLMVVAWQRSTGASDTVLQASAVAEEGTKISPIAA